MINVSFTAKGKGSSNIHCLRRSRLSLVCLYKICFSRGYAVSDLCVCSNERNFFSSLSCLSSFCLLISRCLCLSAYPSVSLSLCLFLSVRPSVCLSVRLPVGLSVCLSLCLKSSNLGFDFRFIHGELLWPSQSRDLKTGIPVDTLPGA